VHRDYILRNMRKAAVTGVLAGNPPVGGLLSQLIVNRFAEKLFHRSITVRRLTEDLRYRVTSSAK
jgi:hypothetical protein